MAKPKTPKKIEFKTQREKDMYLYKYIVSNYNLKASIDAAFRSIIKHKIENSSEKSAKLLFYVVKAAITEHNLESWKLPPYSEKEKMTIASELFRNNIGRYKRLLKK